MKPAAVRRVHGVTALVAFTGVLFTLFFQVNKNGPIGEINPFAVDPYDAVGSFAIQGALLIGALTYARALRMQDDPSQAAKTTLVYRGDLLVLAAIMVTLFVDAAAVTLQPPSSFWGTVLIVELAVMFLLASTCLAVLLVVFNGTKPGDFPHDLTPADGIDDLWILVRLPVRRMHAYLPAALVRWVARFNSDLLFTRARWLNPRTHPWRFAAALGILAGAGLLVAQLQEGLPPSMVTGLLLAGIFLSAELTATLLGFGILGGFLGLRPSLNKQ
jgi:hypothetical protein